MQKLTSYVDGFGFYEEEKKDETGKGFENVLVDQFGRKIGTQVLELRNFLTP